MSCALSRNSVTRLASALLALVSPAARTEATTITVGPVVTVTPHQVTFTWKTDVSSTTEVHFGPAPTLDESGYPNHSAAAGLAGTVHARTLSHLSPGTYYFRVKSVDGGGAPSVSGEHTFVVAAGEDPLGSLVLDGTVYATARAGNQLFFGGSFTEAGTRRGHGVAVDAGSGLALADRPMVAGGDVYAIAPDGSGGFFIGGLFTHVGGLPRAHAAHILPDGGVDPDWNPDVDGIVYSIEPSGSTVYLGGAFTSVGSVPRNHAAAVDASTGALSAWNPDLDGAVFALRVSGSIVYLGGDFNHANGGVARSRAAAVDAAGALTGWNPDLNDTVFAMAVSEAAVYLGGYFSTANGGTTRSRAAAVDLTSGTLTSWNPNLDGQPNAIAVSGSTVYLGGTFQNVNGSTPRNRAAAVDAATGAALAWDPDLNGYVQSLAVAGSNVYVGGLFTTAKGSAARRYAAGFDAATGTLSTWDPRPNDAVLALAVAGSAVYLGGRLTSANAGTQRNRGAALDLTTGALSAWNPDLGADVKALAVSGSTVYLGGAFTTANGGTVRNRAAAVDADSGALSAWDPDLNDRVDALVVDGSSVYLGGRFTRVNGTGGPARNRAAAVDATTGLATTWNPNIYSGNTNVGVRALALSGGTLYVGGLFDHVGGATGIVRNCAAAFDTVSGALTAWDPNFNTSGVTDRVEALAVSGTTVYAGGFFTLVKGTTHPYAVALDATTGTPTSWNPSVGNEVWSIAVSGPLVFLGGAFGTVGGAAQQSVAAVEAASGARADWNPGVGGLGVRTIAADCAAGFLALGGPLTDVGSVPQKGLAAFTGFACPPANSPPEANEQSVSTEEDASVSVTLTGSDANGDPLSFSVVSQPARGVLSGTAPALTYTPNANAHGPDSFTFKVNDGQVDSAIATVSIAIASVDDAPVLAPVGDQSVAVGGTLALTVSAADVDGDAVVLSVDGLPAGATFTAATGAFSWTPAGGDVGDHTVTFTASDGALTDSETVVLAVTSSRPPDSEATGCGCRGGDGGGASLLFLAALVLLGSARRSHRPRPRAPEMASWTTRGE